MTLIKDLERGPNLDDMSHAMQLCDRAARALRQQRLELKNLRLKIAKMETKISKTTLECQQYPSPDIVVSEILHSWHNPLGRYEKDQTNDR